MVDLDVLVSSFLSLLGGGALYKMVSAFSENRRLNAEARKTGIETYAIETKLTPEVTDMSIATMERVHRQLGEDYKRIVAERDSLQVRFDQIKVEFDAMQEALSKANDTIEDLQERLQDLRERLTREEDQ